MRPGVADVECQRGLAEFAAADLDSGGGATERLAAVGADHETAMQPLPSPLRTATSVCCGAIAVRLIVDPRQIRKLGRARFKRRHQRAIFNVVAELVEADLFGRKSDLRRADQPVGIVDQAHRPQCSRPVGAARPDIEAAKEIDGTAEQRGGAIVGIGQATRNQRGFTPVSATATAAANPAGPPPTTMTS